MEKAHSPSVSSASTGEALYREFMSQEGMNTPDMRLRVLRLLLGEALVAAGEKPVHVFVPKDLQTLSGRALEFAFQIVRKGSLQTKIDPRALAEQVRRDVMQIPREE